jgi:hypothetical protein
MRVTLDKLFKLNMATYHLVNFLNVDFRKLPKFDRLEIELYWPARVISQNAKLAEQVQRELRRTLIRVTNPKKLPTKRQVARIIAGLVRKANEADYKVSWLWRVVGSEKIDPVYRECRFWIRTADGEGKIERSGWYVRSNISGSDIEGQIYQQVVLLLESGDLSQVRSCPVCQKFFIVEDPRREFCSEQCRNTFNNNQRLKSGYFTELRHKKRERNMRKAVGLLNKGKRLEQVSRETGLSLGVLRRAGLAED